VLEEIASQTHHLGHERSFATRPYHLKDAPILVPLLSARRTAHHLEEARQLARTLARRTPPSISFARGYSMMSIDVHGGHQIEVFQHSNQIYW